MNMILVFFGFFLATYFLLPTSEPLHAQGAAKPTQYQLLAPIPGYIPTTDGKTTAGPYIKGIFTFMIAIAGALAVVMIIFGGIKYMSTEAIGGKGDARATIENAIWGLILAISAWLILFTVNPKLVEFDLRIPVQEIRTPVVGDINLPADARNCQDCVTVGVGLRHKPAPSGCAAPGPCKINSTLNSKLQFLDLGTNFLITESFPPTRVHRDPCHNTGTCVDATISSNTPQNIKSFIDAANVAGLRAEFEVTSEARASAIRQATGLSSSQVKYISGITGEHFSVYLR
jgi:hypothetical protein